MSAAAVTKRDAIPAARGSTGHPLAAPTGLPLSFRRRAALVRAHTHARMRSLGVSLGRLRPDDGFDYRNDDDDGGGGGGGVTTMETLHVRSECDD